MAAFLRLLNLIFSEGFIYIHLFFILKKKTNQTTKLNSISKQGIGSTDGQESQFYIVIFLI